MIRFLSIKRFLGGALLVTLVGCEDRQPETADVEIAEAVSPPTLTEGYWRGEIEHFGRSLPFNFEVERGSDGPLVTYINGPERVAVEQIVVDGDRVEFNFPSYKAGLNATIAGDQLEGFVFFTRLDGEIQLPFVARHGATHRFFETRPDDYVDVSGRWETAIDYPQFGFSQDAVAIFEQTGSFVRGTVITEVGDFRYLYGEVRGSDLALSAFDGGYTQLWHASLQDGELSGTFDSITYSGATWRASPNADAALRDPTTLTTLKPETEGIDFAFPDMEGNLVSLADDRFDGKVVVVVLAGTWCPSCHDEAAFMAPYYKAHRERGLEIINLMFEYSDDIEDSRDQILAFRDRYAIEYDMLFAGASSRATRNLLLPQLSGIMAFPTTIVIDRRGEVRKIHTAFPGPATGQAHEDYVRDFSRLIDTLLTEPAAA